MPPPGAHSSLAGTISRARTRPPEVPLYYTGLGPFRHWFAHGTPVLTYHKVGPRPPRVRLKGLYVSPRLFRRHLAELRADGFRSCSLDTFAQPSHRAGKWVAITFDDGFACTSRLALPLLAQAGFCAIQFLPASLIGRTNKWEQALGEVPEPLMDDQQVHEWLEAGHQIGSHSCLHPFLTRIPEPQAREEIGASKKRLEDTFGVPVRHFCYPYGDWSPAIRGLVQEAGYATACTTEPGLNDGLADPFALLRLTARYQTRSFRALSQWLTRRWAQKKAE